MPRGNQYCGYCSSPMDGGMCNDPGFSVPGRDVPYLQLFFFRGTACTYHVVLHVWQGSPSYVGLDQSTVTRPVLPVHGLLWSYGLGVLSPVEFRILGTATAAGGWMALVWSVAPYLL